MADDTSPAALVIASVSHLPESTWMPWAGKLGARRSEEAQESGFPNHKGPVVLIFDGVETALAEAMSRGTQPSAALAAWETKAGAILAYWRQRRRLTYLLEAGALLADPAAAAAAVAEWRGLPLAADLSGLKLQEPEAPSPELAALAALPRLSGRSTRKLCDELAAGGLSRTPDASALLDAAHEAQNRNSLAVRDLSASVKATEEALALTRAKQGERIAELTAALAVAEETLTSSRTAQTARAEELTAALSAAEEALAQTRSTLGEKVADLTASLAASQAALDQTRTEQEAKIADLTAALGAALETLDQTGSEHEAKVAGLTAALVASREALDRTRAEHEAKVADLTASLAASQAALDQTRTEQEAKIAEMAADLAAAQLALDQTRAENETKVAGLTTAREALRTENARSGERIAELDAALAVAQHRLAATQARFDDATSRLSQTEVAGQEAELRRLQLLSLQEMLESVQKKHAAEARKQADRLTARELEILQLRAILQDRDQSVVALSEERRLLSLGADERSEEIQVLMNSHSWRLTAPLRATRRILSGARSGS